MVKIIRITIHLEAQTGREYTRDKGGLEVMKGVLKRDTFSRPSVENLIEERDGKLKSVSVTVANENRTCIFNMEGTMT